MQRTNSNRAGILFAALVVSGLAGWGCGSDTDTGDVGDGLENGSAGGAASGGKGGKGTGGTVAITGGGPSVGGKNGSGGTGTAGSTGNNAGSGGACVATSRESSKAVVALYFMVDISGSMKCAVPEADPSEPCEVDPGEPYSDRNRWTDSSAALKNFFMAPASTGLWAGTQFFPSGDMCDEDTYARADAEIAALPGAATGLVSSIDDQSPGGQTPTVPSLRGAVRHASEWAASHDDQQVVVVYLTDGYPRGCDGESNDIATAEGIAEDAFQGDPSIRTYVLGVGPNLEDLNDIAVAGGTQEAFFVDTGADVTAQLTAALGSIRDDVTVECTYTIPDPPPGQTLILEQVNVEYTNGDGVKEQIGYNATTGNCEEGWQFAENNTQVVLCGDTCEQVKSDPGARIDVAFGCARMPFEPR
jgi:hypothetical protein